MRAGLGQRTRGAGAGAGLCPKKAPEGMGLSIPTTIHRARIQLAFSHY
jgi:hypothetical protein